MRLCKRFRRLTSRGKHANVAVTAIARELIAFIWAIAKEVPIPRALGHVACRHGHSVLALRSDRLLKTLKHARLDNSYEVELRKFLAVDLLVVDDFALDAMDPIESRDTYEIMTERHRAGSMIVTSNRGPDEWLATFADPVRAQSAIDRFTSTAYDLVIEGDSYRGRLKPKPQLKAGQKEGK